MRERQLFLVGISYAYGLAGASEFSKPEMASVTVVEKDECIYLGSFQLNYTQYNGFGGWIPKKVAIIAHMAYWYCLLLIIFVQFPVQP